MANPQTNPGILQLAAELAAGRTTSRKLTEEAPGFVQVPCRNEARTLECREADSTARSFEHLEQRRQPRRVVG
mgnify:CR=1 FL=1